MQGFEYSTPSTLKQATAALARAGAMPLAGGTDLLIHTRAGIKSPKLLVDLSGLGLNYLQKKNGAIAIGAMTTFAEILESKVTRELDCLTQSAAEIGCVQTRNMATIGGNICSAVPSADSAPALLVLDARVKIAGRDNKRMVPLNEFFLGPKKNALKPAEIMVEIQAPMLPARTGTSFMKIGRRQAMTLAVVNAAALITLDKTGRVIENVRIALGAVAPVPLRATKAESMLKGCEACEDLIDRAATIAAEEVSPISDIRATQTYRRQVSRVLVQRALMQAWEKAQGV